MTVDYKAIADRAVQIIGSADSAQYQIAFDLMLIETTSEPHIGECMTNERKILSDLGMSAGAVLIDKLGALHPSIARVLAKDGINVLDPNSKAQTTAMLSGGLITQAESDYIESHYNVDVLIFPDLRPGHVQNALEFRNSGRA